MVKIVKLIFTYVVSHPVPEGEDKCALSGSAVEIRREAPVHQEWVAVFSQLSVHCAFCEVELTALRVDKKTVTEGEAY